MGKKRKVNLTAILILLVIGLAIIQSGVINYWQPTPVYVMVDGGGGGTSKHIADTWQKWRIQLDSVYGPVTTYESAKKYVYLPFQVTPSVSGRPYYVEVQMPIQFFGGLPTYGTPGTPGYWYNEIEVMGVAAVYFNDWNNYVGQTNVVPVTFGPGTKAGTVSDMKFIIGTHDGIKYYTTKYGIPTMSKPIDIESYLVSRGMGGWGGLTSFTLFVEVVEIWAVYQVKPFLPGAGYGESRMKMSETKILNGGSVTFNLPQTWTGTYASTATWQTQRVSVTGTQTVIIVIEVPTTVVGTRTYGTKTTVTVTNVLPPIEWPDPLEWLKNALWNWFKNMFGIDLSDWQLWLAIIGLVLIVILLLYLLFRRGGGGGGGQVIVVRALELNSELELP